MKQTLIFIFLLVLAFGIDFSSVNLSDAEQDTIHVTVKGEVNTPGEIELERYATIEDALEVCGTSEKADLSSLNTAVILKDHDVLVIPAKQEIQKISINTADAEELQTLPGVGASTAERIIAWRNENGLFQKIEDLMQVKGIGEAKFAKLKDRICL